MAPLTLAGGKEVSSTVLSGRDLRQLYMRYPRLGDGVQPLHDCAASKQNAYASVARRLTADMHSDGALGVYSLSPD